MNGKNWSYKPKLLALGFILFVLSPYLVMAMKTSIHFNINFVKNLSALGNSVVQATLSALVTLIIGIWSAPHYLKVKNKYKWIDGLLMLPSFLPPLFLLILMLSAFKNFPMGLWGIVLIHSIINIGLCTVLTGRLLRSKMGPWIELCSLLGTSQRQFMIKVAMPLLKKDLLSLFLLIFLICFSSFAIPLVVGGSRFSTLEVYVYDLIFNFNQWPEGLMLVFVQMAVLGCLIVFVPTLRNSNRSTNSRYEKYVKFPYGKKIGLLPSLLPTVLISLIFVINYPKSYWHASRFQSDMLDFNRFIMGTFLISLGGGLFTMLQLLVFAYFNQIKAVKQFLYYYFPVATSVVAFAFFLISGNQISINFFVMCLMLSWVWTPTLYRMQLVSALDKLAPQIIQAKTLGAGHWKIFSQITSPQILEDVCWLSGVAAFWAAGEFALLDIVHSQDVTIAQWIKSLMDNYRYEASLVLLLPMFFMGLICFLIFGGLSRVCRAKYKKAI